MSKDFSSDQGGIQSSSSTEFKPLESTAPDSCCSDNTPQGERPTLGAGPGVGNTRGGIR